MAANPSPTRSFLLALVAILALAFALRVVLTVRFVGLGAPPDAGAQPDQLDYEQYAASLAAGLGYADAQGHPTAFRPPGTSLTLLPAYLAFGRDWRAGRLWFCFLSALTCALAALLAREAFGTRIGLLAGLWMALMPAHAYFGMHFLSEGPFLFWLSLAGLLTYRAWRTETPLALALGAGLALGLAALTRPQALLVLPPAWLLLALVGADARRRALPRLLALSVAFALVLGAWVGRNAAVMGKPTLSTVGGCTFWGAHNERILADPHRIGSWIEVTRLVSPEQPLTGDEFEQDRLSWQYGLEFVRAHPEELPRLAYWKLRRLFAAFAYPANPLVDWAFALSWIVTAPFALVGWVLCWRRDRVLAWILVLPLVATVATALVFYGNVRFRQSVATFYVIPAALALGTLLERGRAERARAHTAP